jgi:tRNA-binding EMAP/Myf-like protein
MPNGEVKSNHRVPVVRITEVLKHPNADRLSLVKVGGYQVVVGLDQFKPGDLAVYVPPDSVVPSHKAFKFVWEFDGGGKPRPIDPTQPIPEKYRRVTVKKLRKEWSEGLLMPLTDLGMSNWIWEEGFDASQVLGITHWNPPEPESIVRSPYHNFEKGLKPKSLRGWWHWILWKLGFGDKVTASYGNEKAPPSYPPVYDVENMQKFLNLFEPDEEVIITEKVHGSNMRTTFQKKMFVGSRQFWKGPKTECVWRKALVANEWLEEWHRSHENYTSYMEVVPTQGGYAYGATADKPRVFLFDILNPEGEWEAVFNNYGLEGAMREHWVPILYRGKFKDADLKKLVSGPSLIAPNQLREGLVIRPVKEREVHGLGRLQLKLINPEFLLKDSQ